MNFEGRYHTKNGLLVAVHKDEYNWKGHVIRTCAPWSDGRVFKWLAIDGRCYNIIGGGDYLVDALEDYSLTSKINPMLKEATMEVVDCEECREYQARSRGLGHSVSKGPLYTDERGNVSNHPTLTCDKLVTVPVEVDQTMLDARAVNLGLDTLMERERSRDIIAIRVLMYTGRS